MFRLTRVEWQSRRSQSVTVSQNKRNTNVSAYAFTEQGADILSGILTSDKAINMNIAIMSTLLS